MAEHIIEDQEQKNNEIAPPTSGVFVHRPMLEGFEGIDLAYRALYSYLTSWLTPLLLYAIVVVGYAIFVLRAPREGFVRGMIALALFVLYIVAIILSVIYYMHYTRCAQQSIRSLLSSTPHRHVALLYAITNWLMVLVPFMVWLMTSYMRDMVGILVLLLPVIYLPHAISSAYLLSRLFAGVARSSFWQYFAMTWSLIVIAIAIRQLSW